MRIKARHAIVFGVFVGACFSPNYRNGSMRCSPEGQCPRNYYCSVDGTCWQDGTGVDALPMPIEAGSSEAAPAKDLARTIDDNDLLQID